VVAEGREEENLQRGEEKLCGGCPYRR